MAAPGERQGIATGAAARVEDVRRLRQQRQEAPIERGHVDVDAVGEEHPRVVLVVVVVQIGHRGTSSAADWERRLSSRPATSAAMLLSTHARTLLEDSGNTLMLSTASVWEIDVKHALGRLRLPDNLPPADFIPEARPRNGVDTLPITGTDALQLPKLPRIHQDPFDRMLICQAIANQAVILTLEPLIARCPVSVQW